MKAVISRVKSASLTSEGVPYSSIGKGLLIYLGVETGDTESDADKAAAKLSGLRIFEDDAGKLNLSAAQVGGEIMAVSNFTLAGDMKKGFRPSFTGAERPEKAEPLFDRFVEKLRETGLHVETGVFRTEMTITNVADGPVTLIYPSLETAGG